ncbi:MAG: PIN domain-containing protein [Chitinophagaceae bacterium]|nr:PIN domain-containing protein [Chitinophagaceae bacterium]
MSGNKYLLDTNAIIALLQGNEVIIRELQNAIVVSISIISYIEFLSYPSLSQKDKSTFKKFVEKVEMIGLNGSDPSFLESIAELKIQTGLKLPDIIIAATAIYSDSILVSNDKEFQKLTRVSLFTF